MNGIIEEEEMEEEGSDLDSNNWDKWKHGFRQKKSFYNLKWISAAMCNWDQSTAQIL